MKLVVKLLLVVVSVCVVWGHQKGMVMVGQAQPPKDATREDQAIADMVRSQVEEQTSQGYVKFVVTKVSKQLVAGFNYFMKVDVGNGEYLHLRIYESLPGDNGITYSLTKVLPNKSAQDPLLYFE